jgi:hypothetical protein
LFFTAATPASARSLSTSQTAMMRAPAYREIPVMSCEVEILPQPIDATLIMLLGAFFPNTLAGTMVGIPLKIMDPVASLAELLRKFLRLWALSNFFMAMLLFWLGNVEQSSFL